MTEPAVMRISLCFKMAVCVVGLRYRFGLLTLCSNSLSSKGFMKRGVCGIMEWEDDTMLLWEREQSYDLVDEFHNVDLLPPILQTHTKPKSLGNPPKSDNLPCNATKQEQLENTNHKVLIEKEKSAELGMEWIDEKMEYEMDDTDWLFDDFFMEQMESQSHSATSTNVPFDWVLDLDSKGLFSNIDNCLGQSQCESAHTNIDKKEEVNLGFNGAIVPCRARTKRPRAQADMGEVCHEESSASKDLSLMKNDMKKSKKKKGISQPRRCTHCLTQKTPQWRMGPLGPKSLCNACGVRFKSGRLFPEYRPAKSPAYQSFFHSNSHKKVMEMRGQIQDAL